MAEDIEKRIAQYIQVRDAIKRVDEKYEAEKKPLLDIQEQLSGRIRAFMEINNITDGLKSRAGTCYLSTRWTASVADAEAFMNFVKEGHWDLIERRANAQAVKDYVNEHNQLPAGCNLNAIQTLGVRRPSGKKD
jgi:hypothetical protein